MQSFVGGYADHAQLTSILVPSRVAVVTDSTASLPAQLADRWNIFTVPMQLQIGKELIDEGYVSTDRLLQAMRNEVPISSQAPAPDAFFWAYQDAWAKGADTIVSLHLSARLSPAAESAKAAAAKTRVPVHIVDAQSSGLTLGFAALAAARLAQTGGDAGHVRGVAEQRAREAKVLIYVDTLEYLRRSGRMSGAAAMVGNALSMKPLLTVNDGQIEQFDKAFGSDRAVAKLIDRAAQLAAGKQVDIGVEHFADEPRGRKVLAELRKRVPHAREFVLTQSSAAIGANTGPGALAITISPF